MINWIKLQFEQWIERREVRRRELNTCLSCEILKNELEHLRRDNDRLLNRLLEKPEPITEQPPPQVTRPHAIPWSVKRQMLEKEDRELAKKLREDKEKELTPLEKEVINAEVK